MKKKYIQNSKILVTGGAGFIGSHLCEALLKLNNTVVCLDNFSTGTMDNIKSLISNPNFNLIGGDIRNEATWKKACEDVDFVFHQAVLTAIPLAIENPITANNVNVSGFVNMLVAAKDANVKQFVYRTCALNDTNTNALDTPEAIIEKSLTPNDIKSYTDQLYANLFRNSYGLNIKGLSYKPISDKNTTTAISDIIQLNMDALEGVMDKAYNLV